MLLIAAACALTWKGALEWMERTLLTWSNSADRIYLEQPSLLCCMPLISHASALIAPRAVIMIVLLIWATKTIFREYGRVRCWCGTNSQQLPPVVGLVLFRNLWRRHIPAEELPCGNGIGIVSCFHLVLYDYVNVGEECSFASHWLGFVCCPRQSGDGISLGSW